MKMREGRVLLLYPPMQTNAGQVCKPNASLAYPNLAGALRDHGVDVRIYDACVGDGVDRYEDIFEKPPTPLFCVSLRLKL